MIPTGLDPQTQISVEQHLAIALFWVVAVVLLGQWGVMTFMWPRTKPEWAVWAKTTAFLSIVCARLVLYYTGAERFPWPVGAVISAVALVLILYFGKVYLWDTWIRGRYDRPGGAPDETSPDHARDFVDRYWGVRRNRHGRPNDPDR